MGRVDDALLCLEPAPVTSKDPRVLPITAENTVLNFLGCCPQWGF